MLTSEQLDMLVQIVTEDSGPTLTRVEFDNAMLMLFENVAGFEHLSQRKVNMYLRHIWSIYKRSSSRNPCH